ncbi:Hypothetical predicted protein [Olea europaea subsp. europaea]|uniref:Uncharacterized protein n=1 Tax=Olea europaea subsp. europaea TaxID=158383 RepID=A0A8S0QNQ4_OLEEU|nr:Hypothetical predicted protein [Olea europaea subsp. europaea]
MQRRSSEGCEAPNDFALQIEPTILGESVLQQSRAEELKKSCTAAACSRLGTRQKLKGAGWSRLARSKETTGEWRRADDYRTGVGTDE